jgi:hypothetical protein
MRKTELIRELAVARQELIRARSRIMLAWLKAHPTPGVYFVSDGELVKIGISGNIESRFRQLRTANGREILLLAIKPETHPEIATRKRLETILHGRFGCLQETGEWFRPGRDLLDYVESLAHPGWD